MAQEQDSLGQEQNWESKEYIQSLPDHSFAIVKRKSNGTVNRLLPHHDKQGNIIMPMLLDSIDRVFELDPNDRSWARQHLLNDYFQTK